MSPMHWIASGGGIGRAPFAPGTVASLAAVLIGALALWIDHRLLTLLAIFTCVIGTWAIHETGEQGDPGWIVDRRVRRPMDRHARPGPSVAFTG